MNKILTKYIINKLIPKDNVCKFDNFAIKGMSLENDKFLNLNYKKYFHDEEI